LNDPVVVGKLDSVHKIVMDDTILEIVFMSTAGYPMPPCNSLVEIIVKVASGDHYRAITSSGEDTVAGTVGDNYTSQRYIVRAYVDGARGVAVPFGKFNVLDRDVVPCISVISAIPD
jgi:hypothetical protein